METLWKKYERTQLEPGHVFEDEHPEVMPRSKVEDIHAWEDWAMENYAETVTVA